ncbi:L,D-transpeptidase [Rhizobium tumorigenes]|uniref:L,D-transpeptidase n=1 Tax=Rhizobium tumorigenes TaxID=2041385 RepID=A0AAF1K7A4_9HYPH|nr:L,D-transpeptidase [Rhizobium tumorigenes]WFR97130.1 L,D-transpeptidase [Rhizobium tumorigenes]
MKTTMLAAGATLCLGFYAASADASALLARIDIAAQTMTVSENGITRYQWKVSTARPGYVTPTGNYTAKWLSRDHHSKKYDNAPMPFAVFFNGGYAVHGTTEVRRLGRPASHGCVRLQTANAAVFFSMASEAGLENTRIVISQ